MQQISDYEFEDLPCGTFANSLIYDDSIFFPEHGEIKPCPQWNHYGTYVWNEIVFFRWPR